MTTHPLHFFNGTLETYMKKKRHEHGEEHDDANDDDDDENDDEHDDDDDGDDDGDDENDDNDDDDDDDDDDDEHDDDDDDDDDEHDDGHYFQHHVPHHVYHHHPAGDHHYASSASPAAISSSYHDNHDNACSAFPVGALETYMKKKSATIMMMIWMM